MFRSKGLYQSQTLHVDNNITNIHDIDRVYIDLIRSVCSTNNYERGFVWLTKDDLSVMIINKCWKEYAISRKIRVRRWIRTLKLSWRSGMNLRTDRLQSICFTRLSS